MIPVAVKHETLRIPRYSAERSQPPGRPTVFDRDTVSLSQTITATLFPMSYSEPFVASLDGCIWLNAYPRPSLSRLTYSGGQTGRSGHLLRRIVCSGWAGKELRWFLSTEEPGVRRGDSHACCDGPFLSPPPPHTLPSPSSAANDSTIAAQLMLDYTGYWAWSFILPVFLEIRARGCCFALWSPWPWSKRTVQCLVLKANSVMKRVKCQYQ